MGNRKTGFWILIIVAVILVVMFLVGQTFSLFNYDLTVEMGLQESVDEVTDVGIAFLKGYAFGDTVFYIPLLIIGIIGLLRNKRWGLFSMIGALAISVYWPAAVLYSIYVNPESMNLAPGKYLSFSILLPLIMIYGLWGMWYLYINTGSDK